MTAVLLVIITLEAAWIGWLYWRQWRLNRVAPVITVEIEDDLRARAQRIAQELDSIGGGSTLLAFGDAECRIVNEWGDETKLWITPKDCDLALIPYGADEVHLHIAKRRDI